MTAITKPFDENAPCPKCGHGEIGVWYHATSRPAKKIAELKMWPKNIPRPPATPRICDGTEVGEHLHRQCKRCHFEWLEDVLRAEV
jgi:hypothetical protein